MKERNGRIVLTFVNVRECNTFGAAIDEEFDLEIEGD
jgi:hypothetical protein